MRNWEAVRGVPEDQSGRRQLRLATADDIEDAPPSFLDDVDCLILGDVLEHLRDPWHILRFLAKSMKPGAQVLASIPNVQHYSLILSLLHGQWTYQDAGLLDRTHLRFFSLQSIKEMFADAGLQIFEIRGRQIETNYESEWRNVLRLLSENTDFPDLARRSQTYQYLVRAIRSEIPVPKLHIHAIGDGTICERPRLHEPMAMLSTIPGTRYTTGPIRDPASNVIVMQRVRFINPDWIRLWLDEDRLLIAEIDDDPAWLKGIPESDYMPLRAVHAIQTTTEVMAETCRRFNPHVAVFPNQIADLPPFPEPRDINPSIFFGALNREADWAPIMPALNRVLEAHIGVSVQVVHDRAFFDALECPLKTFTPFCQWDEYRKILRSCDIALLPLEDNRINRHKSDLKFIECAAEGVAVLASETVYEPDLKNIDEAGICYLNPEGFRKGLEWLINEPHGRRTLAANAYAYVRDHRLLSQHYRRRHEWYLELMSRKKELDRDLLERVPSLRSHSPEPALA